jgi:hypothetical protein
LYFNLNKITNPPDDETVDPVVQLNSNWQQINDKLAPFSEQPTTLINPPVGTEAFYPVGSSSVENSRIAVWSGTSWVRNLNPTAGISVWQPIDARPPVFPRANHLPVAQVDAFSRRVICSGGFVYNFNDVWPNSTIEITTDDAVGPELRPVNDFSYYQSSASPVTGSGSIFAGCLLWAAYTDLPTPHVAIKAKYQGTSALPGNNYINIDGFSWWY